MHSAIIILIISTLNVIRSEICSETEANCEQESADAMERKAAVDCKTVKKANSRVMNFSDEGKEYTCRQVIEKEHKIYTFYKLPADEMCDPDIQQYPCEQEIVSRSRSYPGKLNKQCYKICLNIFPESCSDELVNCVSNSKSGRVRTGYNLSKEPNLLKVGVKRKHHGAVGRRFVKANRRGQGSTERNQFKLPMPDWLKFPNKNRKPVESAQCVMAATVATEDNTSFRTRRSTYSMVKSDDVYPDFTGASLTSPISPTSQVTTLPNLQLTEPSTNSSVSIQSNVTTSADYLINSPEYKDEVDYLYSNRISDKNMEMDDAEYGIIEDTTCIYHDFTKLIRLHANGKRSKSVRKYSKQKNK